MQIGAANLLALQQQQAAKPAQADAGFAKALAENGTPAAEDFEPLFGKPPAPGPQADVASAQPAPAAPQRPGSQLDIKI